MKWGAKVGGKAGKAIEATLKTVDFAGHLGAIGLSANDFGNGISFMIDKYMVGEAEFSSETVWELICLGGHGFQLKSFSGSFMNNVYSGTYDSLIPGMSTANIDLYKVGDWLSQYDKLGNGGFVNPDAEIGLGHKSLKKTRGHSATWEHLDVHGNIIDSGSSQSGGTNPGRVLSWEEQLKTHTESKILNELSEKGTVSQGDTIVIYGTKPPCNPGRSIRPSRGCQKAMQDFAEGNNVNILYTRVKCRKEMLQF